MSAITAYAIADRVPRTAGLEAIECADGIVLCARSGEPPELSIEAVREHDRIVRAIAKEVDAILPMRFGVRGERSALRDRIVGRALVVREGLAAVRDAMQVTLRIVHGPEHEEGAGDESGLGPGARYLLEKARARSPKIPGWSAIARAANVIARAERIERGEPRTERWRVYHLVARPELARWLEAIEQARAAAPEWAITIGAPSPPYAFVPEEIA